jgi:ferritin
MDRNLLSQEAIASLEKRILSEEFSARLYEDMHLWFEDKGLSNLAKLYKDYSDEEWEHAGWGKTFLLSYGYKPVLKTIPSPETDYESCDEILETTLTHELDVQRECEFMAKEALKRGEIALYTLALKYVEEQIDEAAKAIDLLDIKKLSSDMLVFDKYVGKHYLG